MLNSNQINTSVTLLRGVFMSIMENLDFIGEDLRKRKFLMPKTVVKTVGNVAAEIIEKDGIKGFSTFMGYHLLSAMAKAGHYGEALNLMKEYYGEMLKKGATTFFEDYNPEWSQNSSSVDTVPTNGERDIHADFGAFCYKGLRHSFCYGWAAGPVPYLMEYVLGVNIEDEGCRTLRLTPHLDGLDWVKGKFPTPFGVVSIHHKRLENGTVATEFEAPKGVKVIL